MPLLNCQLFSSCWKPPRQNRKRELPSRCHGGSCGLPAHCEGIIVQCAGASRTNRQSQRSSALTGQVAVWMDFPGLKPGLSPQVPSGQSSTSQYGRRRCNFYSGDPAGSLRQTASITVGKNRLILGAAGHAMVNLMSNQQSSSCWLTRAELASQTTFAR